jgi:hypothetical protein
LPWSGRRPCLSTFGLHLLDQLINRPTASAGAERRGGALSTAAHCGPGAAAIIASCGSSAEHLHELVVPFLGVSPP